MSHVFFFYSSIIVFEREYICVYVCICMCVCVREREREREREKEIEAERVLYYSISQYAFTSALGILGITHVKTGTVVIPYSALLLVVLLAIGLLICDCLKLTLPLAPHPLAFSKLAVEYVFHSMFVQTFKVGKK